MNQEFRESIGEPDPSLNKAIENHAPVHKAQVIAYLKATSCKLGLLVNLNEDLLRRGIQRVVLTEP